MGTGTKWIQFPLLQLGQGFQDLQLARSDRKLWWFPEGFSSSLPGLEFNQQKNHPLLLAPTSLSCCHTSLLWNKAMKTSSLPSPISCINPHSEKGSIFLPGLLFIQKVYLFICHGCGAGLFIVSPSPAINLHFSKSITCFWIFWEEKQMTIQCNW